MEGKKEVKVDLPIHEFKDQIVDLVKQNLFCLITGETGSGKSTQLYQFIVDNIRLEDLG